MNRLFVVTVLSLYPALTVAQSPLALIEPKEAGAIRPGQTIVVEVKAASAYSSVWLIGDDAIKTIQTLNSQPYRFSVTIPEKIVAGQYRLWATACRRPGDCDHLDPIEINVEPVWQPSQDGATLVHDASGVIIDTGGVPLMHRSAVAYPQDAFRHWASGTVLVEVTPDWEGRVEGAQALSGPQELRKDVIKAVLLWHFPREVGRKPRQIRISFDPAEASRSVPNPDVPGEESIGVPSTSLIFWKAIQAKPQRTLESINCIALSEDATKSLLNLMPIHPGDTIDTNQFTGLTNIVHNFDSDLRVWIKLVGDRLTVTITPPGFRLDDPEQHIKDLERLLAESQTALRQKYTPQRIKVSAAAQKAKLISKVEPDYPAIAKGNHIQGTVRLSALIGNDGHVLSVDLQNGHALLAQAAEDAAKQWIYSPTFVNGTPVEVTTEIEVEFFLQN